MRRELSDGLVLLVAAVTVKLGVLPAHVIRRARGSEEWNAAGSLGDGLLDGLFFVRGRDPPPFPLGSLFDLAHEPEIKRVYGPILITGLIVAVIFVSLRVGSQGGRVHRAGCKHVLERIEHYYGLDDRNGLGDRSGLGDRNGLGHHDLTYARAPRARLNIE